MKILKKGVQIFFLNPYSIIFNLALKNFIAPIWHHLCKNVKYENALYVQSSQIGLKCKEPRTSSLQYTVRAPL